MMPLRPYQQTCLDQTLEGFGLFDRQLGVAPTGSGKTVLFSHLAKSFLPKKTLILAHREELIDQAIHKLHQSTGIYAEKEKAEWKASLKADVVVASVQTMQRRLDKWPASHFGFVVADEAHHAISKSWQEVLLHFSSAKILGVTATPDRGDKRNLGQYFENIAFEISLFDLINDGWLSKIAVKSVPIKIDLTGVRQTAGDYNEADVGHALEPYMRQIAQVIVDEAAFRKVLVFLPLIATSKAFCAICREHGLNAEHIDGMSPDRQSKLERYADGKIDVLCNAMLLTEGYDCPEVCCVVILRPTRSRSLFSQMVGRGTRIFPGKENLLLLDFLWMHENHSLIRPAHLVASCDEVADEMTKAAEKACRGGESELDLQSLESECRTQREAKLQEELQLKARRKARTIDAMEFALSIRSAALVEYQPTMPWEFDKPSHGQIDVLSHNGIDLSTVKFKGHASKIIDMLATRQDLRLATPKQIRLMKQFGHPNPETLSLEKATAFIGQKLGRGRTSKFSIAK